MALVVLSNFVDRAGWRRVIIANDADPTQSLALKFPPGMTVQQMKDAAQTAIDREIARRQAISARQTTLDQITNSVGLYQQGKLTTPQQATLLAALAAEWKGV